MNPTGLEDGMAFNLLTYSPLLSFNEVTRLQTQKKYTLVEDDFKEYFPQHFLKEKNNNRHIIVINTIHFVSEAN